MRTTARPPTAWAAARNPFRPPGNLTTSNAMPRCLAASAAAGDLCRLAELPVVELWTHAGLRWLQQLRADPFTFVILYAARLSVPEVLHEAARVDGTTKLQAFWHVTLSLLRPAILIAMRFRFIFAFRLFSEVWLLTQGGPTARPRWSASISILRRSATMHSVWPPPPAGSWSLSVSCSPRSICGGYGAICRPMCRKAVTFGKLVAVLVILLWSLLPDRFHRHLIIEVRA